jgi:hypothetical protein
VFITPHRFKNASWSLGRWSRPLNFVAFVWNTYLAGVLFSPLFFPVTKSNFNCKSRRYLIRTAFLILTFTDSPVIFVAITVFGILSWLLIAEDKWLPAQRIRALQKNVEADDSHTE